MLACLPPVLHHTTSPAGVLQLPCSQSCAYACDASLIPSSVQATVGAGLPVIATLKHLRETGDKITRVEGIFSGEASLPLPAAMRDPDSIQASCRQALPSACNLMLPP